MFCHHCGEKQFDPKDLSAKTVSEHVFTSVTEVDGKFISSFWLLISKPGQLTLDYLQGVRKKRLSPFQILLMVNIVFFLMAAYLGGSPFTTRLEFHTNANNFIHQEMAQEMVNQHLLASGEEREAYAQRFNDMVSVQAKSLVMLMVPMMALLVLLLYPKQPYPVVGSLVFMTHMFALMLLVQSFLAPLVSKLMSWLVFNFSLPMGESAFEWIYSAAISIMIGFYFYYSAQRNFLAKPVIHLVKTLVFIFGVYWVYLIYRMLLFFTTFYAL